MDSYLYRGNGYDYAPTWYPNTFAPQYSPVWSLDWPSRNRYRRSRYNRHGRFNNWSSQHPSVLTQNGNLWNGNWMPSIVWAQPLWSQNWNASPRLDQPSIYNMGCMPFNQWRRYNNHMGQPAMWHQNWPRRRNYQNNNNAVNAAASTSDAKTRTVSFSTSEPKNEAEIAPTFVEPIHDDVPLQVDYELTSSFAVDPSVFDDESPGIDFYYPNSGVGMSLQRGQQAVINTHVIVKLPKGIVGVIMDKSSVVTRQDLKVEAGLIDTGYRGEIKIVLRNMSDRQKDISPGQAIAQMLLHKARPVRLNKVDKIDGETNRGTRGFGREQTVEREDEKARCEIF